MKPRYPAILLQLSLLSILFGCHKEDAIDYPTAVKLPSRSGTNRTNDIDTVRLMMPGTYEWVETIMDDRGWTQYSNPWTEHRTRKYVFRADSTVQLYENGRFNCSNKYVVDYELPPGSVPAIGTIVYIVDKTTGNRIESFYPFLSNDSAVFNMPPYTNSFYSRK